MKSITQPMTIGATTVTTSFTPVRVGSVVAGWLLIITVTGSDGRKSVFMAIEVISGLVVVYTTVDCVSVMGC